MSYIKSVIQTYVFGKKLISISVFQIKTMTQNQLGLSSVVPSFSLDESKIHHSREYREEY